MYQKHVLGFALKTIRNGLKSNSYYVRAVRSGKCALLSLEAIHDAYMDCRKRKRGTINALRFEYNLVGNLFSLARVLQKGTYRPSRSVCFVTKNPKLREVFAADFSDRVVHHLVVRELEEIYEPCFIYDSYASRPGKGTHGAVKRLRGFMLQATKNRKRSAWFLQMDIRSYFMSIDKDILFGLLKKKVQSDVLLYLLSVLIYHDCTTDYVFKGDRRVLDGIPPHKSLFKTGPKKGLPIGNLTSQFFANVYLNELDHFVKRDLKCKRYVRYVDDFILVDSCREQLLSWEAAIAAFCRERLLLEIKEGSLLRRVGDGADFLGYVVRPDYVLSRRRVVQNLKRRLFLFRQRIVRPFVLGAERFTHIVLSQEVVNDLRQVLASYLGHFKHADTHGLVESLFEKNVWLSTLFLLKDGRLVERFKYKGEFRSLRTQTRFFRSRFPDKVMFFRVGKYLETYDDQALLMNRIFGFALRADRRGFSCSAGFPAWMKDSVFKRALAVGCEITHVDQGGMGPYVRERYIKDIYTRGE